MKKIFTFVAKKAGFLAAVAAAAVVGGVSTGLVMASIPDANGNLNTCYRNNGGDLRVIDTATDNCANNETAFNLSQAVTNNATAYFRIKDGAVDTATIRNISAYYWYDGTGMTSTGTGWCIDAAFEPLAASATNIGDSALIAVRLDSNGTVQSDEVHNHCTSNYDAFVANDSATDDISIWFAR
jgi:hypothetical protein